MPRTLTAAFAAALAFAFSLSAQNSQQWPLPMGQVHPSAQPLASVPVFAVPALDRVTLESDDETRQQQGLPPRYAVANTVDVTPATHGTWEVLDNAWSLWRLRISAPDASHQNFGFAAFQMPPTGRLMVYSSDYQNVVRPFAAADHGPQGELWTPVVNGAEVVLELYVQTAQKPQVRLHLVHVGSGYRFFGAGPTALGNDGGSGSCNLDVVCPLGAPWVAEIPAIAAISTGGTVFCTGFMVNNTAQNGRNFFMTANHCGITSGNASSLVCYWNYQRAVCGSGTGPLTMFNTGASFRANYATSDFTLVELNATPNPAWGITYVGWNRSTANPTSAVGIHHPSGDDKKISFESQAVTTTSYLNTAQPGDGSHVRVTDWDTGTTEGGSSGSPLFDPNHRVIGQLHGGSAACGNNLSDWYGRFSTSWTGGGTNSTRLSNWLDPLGTNQTTLDTLGNNAASAAVYGTGCYTTFGTFYETFANGLFDLSGTASSTVSVVLTPTGSGYSVAYGGNVWDAPTSANLALGDDALTAAITLPFAFSFPGGSTTQVRMCSNGFVWLNGTSTATAYQPVVADLCSSPPRLAPLWLDLDPSSGGTTHYHVGAGGTAVYFTWNGVPPYGSPSPTNTLQAVLRSNGVIEYRYRLATNMPQGSIVGWSRGNGVTVPPATDISAALPLAVSFDAPGLAFVPVGRPVQGTTMVMNITGIPSGTVFAGVFLGWTKHPSGLSLAGIGMTGCSQYSSQEFVFTVVTGGATYPFSLGVPTGPVWNGVRLYGQAASLSAGFNALGALASNGIDLKFGPN